MQNSRESPNTSKCGIPKTCWGCGALRKSRNSGTHWNCCIPWHCAIPTQSSSIQGILGQGALTAQRAGLGQQVKQTRCRAGGGWVGECIQLASDSGAFEQRPGIFGGGGFVEISVAVNPFCKCLYSSVVERQSCKLKVLGSIPSGDSCASHQPSYPICIARLLSAELIPLQHLSVPTDMPKSWPALPYPMRHVYQFTKK